MTFNGKDIKERFMTPKGATTFSITYGSIFRVILVLLLIWLLYQIIDVVIIIFFGIIVASTVTPAVDKLREEGVPRILGALLIYAAVIVAAALAVYFLVPPTIAQLSRLSFQLPILLEDSFGSIPIPADILERIRDVVADAASGIGAWLFGLVGGLGNIIFVFIISFYLTVEDSAIKDFLKVTLPERYQGYVLGLIHRSQHTLSSWFRTQLMLMFIVGLLTFIGLSLVGVPFALVLAVIAGIFEIVPFAGPILAAIPAILFALEVSPGIALITLIVFLFIQQLEGQVLTPLVVKRTLDINPILALVALFVGGKLGGIIGILASIPLLALALEFAKDYFSRSLTE